MLTFLLILGILLSHVLLGFFSLVIMYYRNYFFNVDEMRDKKQRIDFLDGTYGMVWQWLEARYVVLFGTLSFIFLIFFFVFGTLLPTLYFILILYPLSKLNGTSANYYIIFMKDVIETLREPDDDW